LTPQIAIQRLKITNIPNIDNPLNMVFPNASDHIEMNENDQPYLVNGWYQPEKWAEGSVRWTKKEPVFILKISGRKIKLEVGTSKPNIEKEPIIGDVFCNGTRIGNLF
jgi:hypothetical protein